MYAHAIAALNSLCIQGEGGYTGTKRIPYTTKYGLALPFFWDTSFSCVGLREFDPALAQEAIDIEMKRLGEPVGKQDQYIAAYGGLICQEYLRDDSVVITPLRLSQDALRELRDSLMLFFVGSTRKSAPTLGGAGYGEQGDERAGEPRPEPGSVVSGRVGHGVQGARQAVGQIVPLVDDGDKA